MRSLARRWLDLGMRPGEKPLLLWSFVYFFFLLAAYYVLRPLRDEMGIAGGVRNLQWLFSATFAVMLAAVPAFGALVARLPRRRFIPLVYQFFVANLVIFWLLLSLGIGKVHVARIFFVWLSVFNLFAVSVFWSFMADLFGSDQGKRLFGLIAAGGSAGALLGPVLTMTLVPLLGPINLLLVAGLLLELAILGARRLELAADLAAPGKAEDAKAPPQPVGAAADKALGGHWLAGIVMLWRSPYLGGIALWVFLLSLAGTFLYFQQASLVAAASDDPAVRTQIFAGIDLATGLLTLLLQCFATGRLISRFGVGPALAFLPLVFLLGFLVLAVSPLLAAVIAFQALQRTANFALSNPAREVLFTVLARDEKYKAKNVIDIVVFRGADALNGWLFAALRGIGLELAAISWLTLPVAALWAILAIVLGRSQEQRARCQAGED